jgi:hypothetical protein
LTAAAGRFRGAAKGPPKGAAVAWRWTRAAPSAAAFALAVLALLPAARALPEHGDEAQYVWSAAYFGGRAARLDFGAGDKDSYTDPGWHPQAAWSASQPMGSRLVYAAELGLTGAPAPALPYS